MKYLTAIEASKRIGVSEKTIRLWIKEGKLEAHHPAKNRLAIAEADVERLAQERQLYYGARPETPSSTHTLPDISVHDIDALFTRIAQLEHQPEISVLTRELGKLQAKVDVQDARIAELERRFTELEARNVPRQPIPPSPTSDIIPQSKPPKRNIAPSPDLPDGAIGLSDFAAQHGISLSSASRWARNGDIPTELRQRAGRPQHFLTIEQQEQAIEWMRKYGKLS